MAQGLPRQPASQDGSDQGVLDGVAVGLEGEARCCGRDRRPMPPAGRHQGSGTLASPTVSPFPSADVVNLDLKSTLRVLYNLFTKYKDLE